MEPEEHGQPGGRFNTFEVLLILIAFSGLAATNIPVGIKSIKINRKSMNLGRELEFGICFIEVILIW